MTSTTGASAARAWIMTDSNPREEHIQSLANILSLIAIIGRMDKAAIQRVLASLGSTLLEVPGKPTIERDLARKLITEVAREQGDEAALAISSDIAFVAKAWQPVLDEYLPADPYQLVPYAEVLFALVNHSGTMLQNYEAFDRFGGADVVLPMAQLTAALRPHAVPAAGLAWEMIGFRDPADQALVASDREALYLFKAAVRSMCASIQPSSPDSSPGCLATCCTGRPACVPMPCRGRRHGCGLPRCCASRRKRPEAPWNSSADEYTRTYVLAQWILARYSHENEKDVTLTVNLVRRLLCAPGCTPAAAS